MPGIVGYVLWPGERPAVGLLPSMALALEPDPRFVTRLHESENVGLGRVSLELVDQGPQPVWNEEGTICAVMEGELYDRGSLVQDMRSHRPAILDYCDAALALHLYEEFGERFLARLNGAFVLAIWDRAAKRLILANDRLGLYPLYYARIRRGLMFASGVRALLAEPSLPRSIDRVAIGEFLTFDHILGDRTLLEEVRLLPQASFLIVRDRKVDTGCYWNLRYPEFYPLRREGEDLQTFLHLLRQAVERRLSRDDLPTGILLSGGLDSRFLLAHMRSLSADRPLHAFTWGIPGCDDIRYAREVSRITRARHHVYRLKEDWLLSKADDAIRITDGMSNLVNLHAFANLDEENRHVQVLYKGFMGDALMGFGLRRALWSEYDSETKALALLRFFTDFGLINFSIEEVRGLLTTSFGEGVPAAMLDSFAAALEPSGSRQLAAQCNYFYLTQRVPRMTIKGVEVVRSRMMVRLPYTDNDLVEFALTVTPGLLSERELMKNALVRSFPHLAKIPITETGLPLMSCMRDVIVRTGSVLRWHLHSAGLHRVPTNAARPCKDYDSWFRTKLRGWAERTLTSSRALDRGIFNPDGIRRLIADNAAGRPSAVRLGALMAVELWHRQLIDRERDP